MQEVMRETAGWSELVSSPGLTAIIQFGWDTTEFSWEGGDGADGTPLTDRGWAILQENELRGMIFIHLGDDSEMVVVAQDQFERGVVLGDLMVACGDMRMGTDMDREEDGRIGLGRDGGWRGGAMSQAAGGSPGRRRESHLRKEWMEMRRRWQNWT